MLLALLLLPWAWGALAASPHLPPASVTLRLLQTTVFHNASSTDTVGTALLGDLETHSLACGTCKIRFLQPWAQQGLTPKQWGDLELLIHHYLFNFNRTVKRMAQQQRMGYPFVTQGSIGCELHPNSTSRGFYDAGLNGEDFISFDADAGKWVAQQADKLALYVQDLLNQDKGTASTLQFLLRTTEAGRRGVCPSASPSRDPRAGTAGLPGHRFLPPASPRGLAAGRGGGGARRAAELQWDPAQCGPDLPAAQLPGRGAGHRAQLRLPGAAQQPGGPEPADPLGAEQALEPQLGRGHHPGGSGRSRRAVRAAVVLWRSRRRGYQDVRPGEPSA
ncbi:antigen-presenting glycoprotein CD1d-like isoform X3 [Gopherus evgoodei]|uniref:antigen-presenting glycoprotein CD1d-like isoform X3 n=1 Tax=Gopherus evgoodei TaxID=1825980 RepID=UPI0011CF1A9C|nr:antigen-presenting glycoprotein CD1d-like isoform X3 [Gopherus evgoodei]